MTRCIHGQLTRSQRLNTPHKRYFTSTCQRSAAVAAPEEQISWAVMREVLTAKLHLQCRDYRVSVTVKQNQNTPVKTACTHHRKESYWNISFSGKIVDERFPPGQTNTDSSLLFRLVFNASWQQLVPADTRSSSVS